MVVSSNSPIKSALRATGVTQAKDNTNVPKNTDIPDPENPDNPNAVKDGGSEEGSSNKDDGSVAKKLEGFKAEKQGSVDQYAETMALQQQQEQEQQAAMSKIMQSQQQAEMMRSLMGQMPQAKPQQTPQAKPPSSNGSRGPSPKIQEKPEAKEFNRQSKPAEKPKGVPDKLKDAVRNDAERLHGKNSPDATSRSMSLLNEYGRKYDLSDNDTKKNDATRRLAMHGVDLKTFEAVKNDPKNHGKTVPELASSAISAKNEEELSGSPAGREALKFLEGLGFGKGELHQISSSQALEMHQNFEDGDQSGKSALFLVSNNHAEFDLTKEIDSFKKMTGAKNVFVAQFDSENPTQVKEKVKELVEQVGPFSTLLPGGHGGENSASILFGNKVAGESNNEKLRLDPSDKNDPEVVDFFKDKEIFKDGVSIIGLACNFCGNDDTKADGIKAKDSMQAFFQDLRPDADVTGPTGSVPSFAYFYKDEQNNLKHSNIEKPVELAALDDKSADRSESPTERVENLDLNFEELELDFGD